LIILSTVPGETEVDRISFVIVFGAAFFEPLNFKLNQNLQIH